MFGSRPPRPTENRRSSSRMRANPGRTDGRRESRDTQGANAELATSRNSANTDSSPDSTGRAVGRRMRPSIRLAIGRPKRRARGIRRRRAVRIPKPGRIECRCRRIPRRRAAPLRPRPTRRNAFGKRSTAERRPWRQPRSLHRSAVRGFSSCRREVESNGGVRSPVRRGPAFFRPQASCQRVDALSPQPPRSYPICAGRVQAGPPRPSACPSPQERSDAADPAPRLRSRFRLRPLLGQ